MEIQQNIWKYKQYRNSVFPRAPEKLPKAQCAAFLASVMCNGEFGDVPPCSPPLKWPANQGAPWAASARRLAPSPIVSGPCNR